MNSRTSPATSRPGSRIAAALPPFRFKERGAAGVLCDAAGEQLFPALVAVALACRGAQRAVSGAWVASVAVWALAYGLRGIVWHQLSDVDNDRAAGFRTFARRHPRAAPFIGTFVVSLSRLVLSRPCCGRSAAHGRRRFSCCMCSTPFPVRTAGQRCRP